MLKYLKKSYVMSVVSYVWLDGLTAQNEKSIIDVDGDNTSVDELITAAKTGDGKVSNAELQIIYNRFEQEKNSITGKETQEILDLVNDMEAFPSSLWGDKLESLKLNLKNKILDERANKNFEDFENTTSNYEDLLIKYDTLVTEKGELELKLHNSEGNVKKLKKEIKILEFKNKGLSQTIRKLRAEKDDAEGRADAEGKRADENESNAKTERLQKFHTGLNGKINSNTRVRSEINMSVADIEKPYPEEIIAILEAAEQSAGSHEDRFRVDPEHYSEHKNEIDYALQVALTTLGYPVGGIDGLAGKKTKEGVKAYQKANGLDVDGDAGYETIRDLINNFYAKVGDIY